MRKLLHLSLFVLAFQMEVRVRASNHSEVLSEPANCAGLSTPCSFKVSSRSPWVSKSGKGTVTAKPGSLVVEVIQAKEWTLMEGALWMKNTPSVKVKTASATVEGSSGEYWVLADKEKVLFRNISSRLIVTLKDQTKLEVPRGFQVWAGNVDSQARVQHGVVEPIVLKDHLKLWYSVFPGTRAEFLSQVQDLKDQWVDIVEQSGEIYQQVAIRKIAAIEELKRDQQAAQKKKLEHDAKLRQKFYDKVFHQ